MSFRKPYVLIREMPGSYVDGEWVPGSPAPVNIMASIQPVTGKDQITVPEGRRLTDFIKIYTDTEVLPVDEAASQQPDKLTWRGRDYECVQVDPRQMGVISHYKAIFSRIMTP